jgi:hypothetical protein
MIGRERDPGPPGCPGRAGRWNHAIAPTGIPGRKAVLDPHRTLDFATGILYRDSREGITDLPGTVPTFQGGNHPHLRGKRLPESRKTSLPCWKSGYRPSRDESTTFQGHNDRPSRVEPTVERGRNYRDLRVEPTGVEGGMNPAETLDNRTMRYLRPVSADEISGAGA